MKMNDLEKVAQLVDLIEAGNGRVAVSDLLAKTGTPRRARRAIFVARKGGMTLEPVRDGGRDVIAYVRTNNTTLQDIETAIAAKRKRQPKKQPIVDQAVTPSAE